MQTAEFNLKPSNNDSPAYIELNKLLKFMQLCENGGMANAFIADGLVKVNGSVDTRKRAKIKSGDVVLFEDVEIHVK